MHGYFVRLTGKRLARRPLKKGRIRFVWSSRSVPRRFAPAPLRPCLLASAHCTPKRLDTTRSIVSSDEVIAAM
jgi:hypothetical protein